MVMVSVSGGVRFRICLRDRVRFRVRNRIRDKDRVRFRDSLDLGTGLELRLLRVQISELVFQILLKLA